MATNIEWTDETWNPMTGCLDLITGCASVSSGCMNCYARRMSKRLAGRYGYSKESPFQVTIHRNRLDKPYHWKKPRMIFVNSMGDLFHKNVHREYIKEIFKVMNDNPRHTFQILTKRPERMLKLDHLFNWTPNIWMGVSIESKAYNYRADMLKLSSALIKFISFEPLVGTVNGINTNPFDWFVVGGETGHGAREMKKEWVDYIYLLCRLHRNKPAPFFFKGWGTATMKKIDPEYFKYKGQQWREMPNVSEADNGK